MSDLRKRFGSRIRELRESQGLSQEKLAEKADLHPTYIGGVERGERNLSLESIVKISTGLGTPLTEIFDFHLAKKRLPEDEILVADILKLLRKLDNKDKRLVRQILKPLVKALKR